MALPLSSSNCHGAADEFFVSFAFGDGFGKS